MDADAKRQLLLERMMRGRVAGPVSPLVTLNAGGNTPAFFCVHASGGSAVPYLALAQELGHEFHALEAPGIHGGQPLERVEDLAEHYLDAIRRVQPSGPYHVGGWSVGGTIALEMACRLGGEAASLILLDTKAGGFEPAPGEREILSMYIVDVALLQDRTPPAIRLSDADPYRDATACLEAAELTPAELREQTMHRLRVFVANTRAFHRYRARRFEGNATLISAETSPAVNQDRWRGLLPRVRCRTVPGTHYTMLRPPVLPLVAGAVRECLS